MEIALIFIGVIIAIAWSVKREKDRNNNIAASDADPNNSIKSDNWYRNHSE